MKEEKKGDASSLKGKGGIIRILNSARYSMAGFKSAFKNEAAFRKLIFLNIILQPIAWTFEVSKTERAILILTPLLSLAVELLNTAIENAIDRVSLEFHPLSKNAKDMGSAAQFVALVMIVVSWLVILL